MSTTTFTGGDVLNHIAAQGLLDSVLPGDRVTIVSPQHQLHTGRAMIVTRNGLHVQTVALDMGGKHGRPGLATVSNVRGVNKARRSSQRMGYIFQERGH